MVRHSHSKLEAKSQVGAARGELFVVATPIGHLGDITVRALEVLKSVDCVACEDTRTSGTLLHHYGIRVPKVAYHNHNEAKATAALLETLRSGKRVALITDAGTPLVSDPGSRLVVAAIEAGIRVTPIPGASALVAALSIAGLPTDHFCFVGFLPTKKACRTALLAWVAPLPATLVFYEAPHRLVETLQTLADTLGDRSAAVARELTKLHETCTRGTLHSLIAHYTQEAPRGECVLVVHGATAQPLSDAAIDSALREALHTHSLKAAVDQVTQTAGRPRSEIYERALAIRQAR